ncbi:NodB homology domain-containing protein [Pseudoscourfieldia marina]
MVVPRDSTASCGFTQRVQRPPPPRALWLPLWLRRTLWSVLFVFGARPSARLAALFVPALWFFPDANKGEEEEEHVCALTIDDAPGDEPLLNELLDTLDRYKARATFFVTSGMAARCAETDALARIVRRGHDLANHLVEDMSYAAYGAEAFRAALEECQRVIDEVNERVGVAADRKERFYRPPRGRINKAHRRVLAEQGYCVVMGDVFPNDPHILDAKYIANFVGTKARPGSIVILHMPERGFRDTSLRGVAGALARMSLRNLRCNTLAACQARHR